MEVILQNLTKKFPNRDKKKKGDVIAVDHFDIEIPDRIIGDFKTVGDVLDYLVEQEKGQIIVYLLMDYITQI